nr:extracellular solute-binding protein [Clostridia bacterium]
MFIAGTFASCGDSTAASDTDASDTADTTTAETTADPLADDVPELNFEGAEFKLLTSRAAYYEGRIIQPEQTGEALDDALYERTRMIEERFNIKFSDTVTTAGVNKDIETTVLAGEEGWHVGFPNERSALALAQNKLIHSISDLEYIDLSRPWWTKDINNCLTIGGELFFASGEMSLTSYNFTSLLFYNKTIAEEYALGDITQMVYDGTWTFDKFEEFGVKVTSDSDGDGDWTENDTYGFLSEAKAVLPCFWIAANTRTVSKDADDIPYFSVPGDEKFQQVFTRIFEMTYDNGMRYTEDGGIHTMFPNGKALFINAGIGHFKSYRDMEDDFGAIPLPKFDEAQEDYHTRVGAGFHVSVVPLTRTDTEMIGAIIEATTAESYRTVIPAFYETSIKGKYARDAATIEMLDFIMARRTADPGDTLWCNQIRDGFMRTLYMNNVRDLASAVAANEEAITKAIESAVELFEYN